MTIKVFPALAGVILQWQKLLDQKLSFSRTRGGDPIVLLDDAEEDKFFPHSRG